METLEDLHRELNLLQMKYERIKSDCDKYKQRCDQFEELLKNLEREQSRSVGVRSVAVMAPSRGSDSHFSEPILTNPSSSELGGRGIGLLRNISAPQSVQRLSTNNRPILSSSMAPSTPLPRPAEESGDIRERMEEIKQAYNSLNVIGNASEQRRARNDFIRKYQVVGLICTNSQARMGNPSLAPEFGDAGSPQQGDLWAAPLGKPPLYAVMPRQGLNYEHQRNESGGLGEIFDSNFEGGTYARIELLYLAIFQRGGGGWVSSKKGQIRLTR